jgi:hypothetical protein
MSSRGQVLVLILTNLSDVHIFCMYYHDGVEFLRSGARLMIMERISSLENVRAIEITHELFGEQSLTVRLIVILSILLRRVILTDGKWSDAFEIKTKVAKYFDPRHLDRAHHSFH